MIGKPFTYINILLLFASCTNHQTAATKSTIDSTKASLVVNDKIAIQNLVRKMLTWAEVNKCGCDLLPAIENKKDSSYIGFDLEKLRLNLKTLDSTDFFSPSFVENYKQIILTLDEKIRSGEFGKWITGDLPIFSFANDIDPWCLCQDVPYDKPNPWSLVEVNVVKLEKDSGELYWRWGSLPTGTDHSWSDAKYKFRVEKINGQWKISYLQGFDFKDGIKKDGL